MNLLQCYLISNDCYKAAKTIRPSGIVVHSTGANNKALKRYVQPTATQKEYLGGITRQEAIKLLGANLYNNDWNRPGINKCVHAFIGQLASGAVATVQTLPWAMRSWGCGAGAKGSYNNSHIQFEICEDGLVDKSYFDKAFKEATELCVHLCREYSISVDNIVSHAEAHKLGYASNHGDPEHWMKRFGVTMRDFRAAVASGLISTYTVRVTAAALNIRSGPGVSYKVVSTITDGGVYTIVDTKNGWGKLKSGVGWISLKYTTRVTGS